MSRTSHPHKAGSFPVSSTPPHAAVLNWLDELRAAMRHAPLAELLEVDGVDVLDVLLSPLYLAVLNALRNGGRDAPSPLGRFVGMLREWSFHRKIAMQERIAARHSAEVQPSDIVLWTRDITHTVNLLPVATALRNSGKSCSILACQPNIFHELRKRKVEAVYTMGAWPRIARRARREGASRAKQLALAGRWSVPPTESAVGSRMEEVVRATTIRYLPLVAESTTNARVALSAFGCRLLVVGNDLTVEGRAACRVAAASGIPTAVFMHGSTSGGPLPARHCTDRLLVFGDSQRRDLLGLGISEEQIVVCGSPSLDGRPTQTGRNHPALASRLGLEPDEPWILVATSGPGHSVSHEHHERVVANLARLSAALDEVPIVVKLHRKDRLAYYRRSLKDRAGGRFFVVPQGARGFPPSIFDWLQGCGMVLTGISTVATEAMLMDVPVITMDFCDEFKGTDFIDAGATVHVRTFEALETAVRGLLDAGPSDELKRRVAGYLKDAFLELDGRSGERGAAAICELVEQGNAS